MILQALADYYDARLSQGAIAPPGWDEDFGVSFRLELDSSGALIDVIDCRSLKQTGKKQTLIPARMTVPAHVKRSSGIAANFLCDKAEYILGTGKDGPTKRTLECFAACAALHHELLDGVDDPAARAVLAFFGTWDPGLAAQHPLLRDRWKDITENANLIFIFELGGTRPPVTEVPVIKAAWQTHYERRIGSGPTAQCLISGETAALALTHPSIKGVRGAQSSGASLVSFNAAAYSSYGHTQGENAPVSGRAAFAYGTALNALLADREHCRRIGDTTVICWAENADKASADLGTSVLFGVPEELGVTDEDLTSALKLLSEGKPCDFLGQRLLPGQHIYFLGLAPNSARLSVRFFLRDSLEHFSAHIREHYAALEIVRPAFDGREHLDAWALVRETTRRGSDGKYSDPAPQLSGSLLYAILTGGRYPATLLNGVTLRIRAERSVNRARAAILKAYYTRNTSPLCPKEVLTVQLNEQSDYQPYVLGRLFFVLEAIQHDASPNINTTIKDRYFKSACATPAVVFPTLLMLAQKHLQKLDGKKETSYNIRLTELIGKMPAPFPARLTLPEQGAFEIGYYHQAQKHYEKKNREEKKDV